MESSEAYDLQALTKVPVLSDAGVIVISSRPATASALARFISSAEIVVVGQAISFVEVVETVEAVASRAEVLVIDAHLTCQEFPASVSLGGLHLYKHMRLTPGRDHLHRIGVAVVTLDSFEFLLQNDPENILLLAPGCKLIRLPAQLSELRSTLARLRRMTAKGEVTQSRLRPYVYLTPQDQLLIHTYRNRAGVARFLNEFAGRAFAEANPGSMDFQQGYDLNLWIKKIEFLETGRGTGAASSDDAGEFWAECGQKRFLYIDDEHRLGWSYALYCGLFGDAVPREAFELHMPLLSAPNERLLCIDSLSAACEFIEGAVLRLQDLLRRWGKTRDRYRREIRVRDREHARRGDPESLRDARRRAELPGERAWQLILRLEEKLSGTFPYDLVFLDLRLKGTNEDGRAPEFSGMALLARIHEAFPYIPVIILTASEKAISSERARELGAEAYWIKGVSSGMELRSKIEVVLRFTAGLKQLWLKVQQVKNATTMSVWDWTQTGWQSQVLEKTSWDRKIIHLYLEESFLLLRTVRNTAEPHADPLPSERSDYPYDRIVLNMGIIQELRFRGPSRKEWFNRLLQHNEGHVERKLRDRRNQLAHGGGGRAKCTAEEATIFLRYTLSRLLGEQSFRLPTKMPYER